MNNHKWKGKNKKSGKISVWCCGNTVGRGSCGGSAVGRDRNYGIGPVGGYGAIGGMVYYQHQNVLKLISCLGFYIFVMCCPYI